MKKILLAALTYIFLLSGCVKSFEDRIGEQSDAEAEYNAAFKDGYKAGFEADKNETLEESLKHLEKKFIFSKQRMKN